MSLTIDTNVYRALRAGDADVVERLSTATMVIVPVAVVAELLFGFRNGTQYRRNRSELDAFLGEPVVEMAAASLATAEWYGRIATGLRRKGRPIPTNDIWIAATAMERGAELLSFDTHFGQIDGLAWTNPSVAEGP